MVAKKNRNKKIIFHTGSVQMRTERLLLRPFRLDDAAAMFEWAGDNRVTEYMTWSTHASIEDSKAVIDEWQKGYADKSLHNWAIEELATGKVIGSIGIIIIDESKAIVKIGYSLSFNYWGQGIMPEAAKKVIEHCFFNMGVKTIYAEHIEENTKSGRVMQKAGMQYIHKVAWGERDNQGRLRDILRYVINKEEG